MKDKDIFRFTEKLLFSYKDNLARLETLSGDLRVLRVGGDVHAQSYQLSFNFSEPSDPVAAHTEKIISLENQIKRLERNTTPITRLIQEVDKCAANASEFAPVRDFQGLLKLFYFGGLTLYDVAIELKRSRRTISERRKSLVRKAAAYLGL